MGRHSIASEIFDNESKIDFGVRDSVLTVDDVTPYPPVGSSIQLFESEPLPEEHAWRFGVREWLVFVCIVILSMMDSFNATSLIPALPELSNTFGKPLASTLWVNTVYLIFSATSQLYFTMTSEVFSHGPVWIIAVVFATIGTGICCGSMSLIELIIGRMIQGIGGGGAMSLCFVIMAESTPQSIHSRYSCYILLTRMCGTILGPVVSGIFVDNTSWTWALYFNFIFCALGLLAIPFAVDLRVSKSIPLRKLRILDWSGATMAFLGSGAVLVGLTWGGSLYRWEQWQTIVPIAVGAAVFFALVFYEFKWALHPLFGRRVFRSRLMVMTYLGCFLHGFMVFAHLQFFPLYFMSTHYMSATLSAVALLAMVGMEIVPAAIVGVILARESRCTQWIISSGWILIILSGGCSILLDSTTPAAGWVFLLFTAGLGHGLLLASYNVRVQNVPNDDEDPSLSTLPTTVSHYMRAMGMAFAVPVGGVVLLNIFRQELTGIGLDRNLVNTANGYLILMNQVKMSSEHREAVTLASVAAFRVLWEVLTGVAFVGGISSVFLWRRHA
ncbi:hypothetical protein N7508_003614 [Penicillium antarcticum]|uniref:uncharacterized protein n=1 Tax=Penicillium antarcticum TaxID=416450 RepID=UPI002394AE67|nr:uncharacterized protein N7508_003614 [Penicillium antarcticum]KAJ5312784.1 hypothetical protein N7508_003614 [Penicillium antarcticum]